MKTIFKVILPVLAFTMASAGAVMTKDAKIKDAKKSVLISGFIQNPSPANCLPVSVDCTTTGGQTCMSNEAIPRQVWLKNAANACSVNLYKVAH
ncbi:hypothetical protein H4V97_003135 [Flavobacterium sp. CG_23.5]|uniref:DUF6520 family protein n=1 Tax=Flavobacterium sp. CG_23.5 TaxID=2760708 RepID=UPI001AE82DDF|nr:DUF6520 family protein [Flavobacterium sp. CG_23.5]MBP2284817.1 hypothetical protein [Flavobacterium sp. CG_23.5]